MPPFLLAAPLGLPAALRDLGTSTRRSGEARKDLLRRTAVHCLEVLEGSDESTQPRRKPRFQSESLKNAFCLFLFCSLSLVSLFQCVFFFPFCSSSFFSFFFANMCLKRKSEFRAHVHRDLLSSPSQSDSSVNRPSSKRNKTLAKTLHLKTVPKTLFF